MSRARKFFPVGLYASLLLALLALAQPRVFAPLGRWCSAAAALPFRAYGMLGAQPALATNESDARSRAVVFWSRAVASERRARPAAIPSEFAACTCAVRGQVARGTRLVLDRRWGEIADCADFVTVGHSLVGFLAPRGNDADWAEVQLLGRATRGQAPVRSVPARVETPNGELRFVVEQAAGIDPWPLRCALIDDPYVAAGLQSDGHVVVTQGFVEDPLGVVPPDLRIGELRVWGYERDGRRLPVGFFVDPSEAGRAPLVTLWQRGGRGGVPVPDAGLVRHAVQAFSMTPGGGRWFVAVPFETRLGLGASVVRGERLVGTVTTAGPGYAFVTPLGLVGQEWQAVFMPVRGAVRDVIVHVTDATDERVALRVEGTLGIDGAGALFTGGAHGPAGLWLGDVEPGRIPNTALMTRAAPPDRGGLALLVRSAEVRP